MTLKSAADLLKETGSKWSGHNAPRLGAALAYYTLLSMAPLLILTVSICAVVFKANAEMKLLSEAQGVVGSAGAKTLKMLIDNAHHPGAGILATLIALATLLFGASGVFVELRDSLNNIWDAPPPKSSSWQAFVKQRLVSFAMVLGLGALLLVSLVASAAMSVIATFFAGFVPVHTAILGEIANFLFSLAALAVLFGLIFKFVPDVPIDWRDVGIGAAFTAVLFTIGKGLLGLYLGTAGVGSTYGAAGSIVALVVWVYYSAQIFFFGAEFTRVYANSFGSYSSAAKRKLSTLSNLPPAQGHSATA